MLSLEVNQRCSGGEYLALSNLAKTLKQLTFIISFILRNKFC